MIGELTVGKWTSVSTCGNERIKLQLQQFSKQKKKNRINDHSSRRTFLEHSLKGTTQHKEPTDVNLRTMRAPNIQIWPTIMN